MSRKTAAANRAKVEANAERIREMNAERRGTKKCGGCDEEYPSVEAVQHLRCARGE